RRPGRGDDAAAMRSRCHEERATMTEVWVLRHGESTANVEGRIVSAPGPRALTEVGLTARGRDQARQAGRVALEHGFGAGTVIVTSDFARARETAAEFAAALGAAAPRVDERLRERSFGAHEEGPTNAYETVWAADRVRRDPGDEVELVTGVAARVDAALRAATARGAARAVAAPRADAPAGDPVGGPAGRPAGGPTIPSAPVVLVAHGDVLQIALAVGAGMD